jgi:hypothetical protein
MIPLTLMPKTGAKFQVVIMSRQSLLHWMTIHMAHTSITREVGISKIYKQGLYKT